MYYTKGSATGARIEVDSITDPLYALFDSSKNTAFNKLKLSRNYPAGSISWNYGDYKYDFHNASVQVGFSYSWGFTSQSQKITIPMVNYEITKAGVTKYLQDSAGQSYVKTFTNLNSLTLANVITDTNSNGKIDKAEFISYIKSFKYVSGKYTSNKSFSGISAEWDTSLLEDAIDDITEDGVIKFYEGLNVTVPLYIGGKEYKLKQFKTATGDSYGFNGNADEDTVCKTPYAQAGYVSQVIYVTITVSSSKVDSISSEFTFNPYSSDDIDATAGINTGSGLDITTSFGDQVMVVMKGAKKATSISYASETAKISGPYYVARRLATLNVKESDLIVPGTNGTKTMAEFIERYVSYDGLEENDYRVYVKLTIGNSSTGGEQVFYKQVTFAKLTPTVVTRDVTDTFNPYWYKGEDANHVGYNTLNVSFKEISGTVAMTPDWTQVKYYSDAGRTKEISSIAKGGIVYATVPAEVKVGTGTEAKSLALKYVKDDDGNESYVPQTIVVKLKVQTKSVKAITFYKDDVYGTNTIINNSATLLNVNNYNSSVYAPHVSADGTVYSIDTKAYSLTPEYYFRAPDQTADDYKTIVERAWNCIRGITGYNTSLIRRQVQENCTIVCVEEYNGTKTLAIISSWDYTTYTNNVSEKSVSARISFTIGNQVFYTTLLTPSYKIDNVELLNEDETPFTGFAADEDELVYDARTAWTAPSKVKATIDWKYAFNNVTTMGAQDVLSAYFPYLTNASQIKYYRELNGAYVATEDWVDEVYYKVASAYYVTYDKYVEVKGNAAIDDANKFKKGTMTLATSADAASNALYLNNAGQFTPFSDPDPAAYIENNPGAVFVFSTEGDTYYNIVEESTTGLYVKIAAANEYVDFTDYCAFEEIIAKAYTGENVYVKNGGVYTAANTNLYVKAYDYETIDDVSVRFVGINGTIETGVVPSLADLFENAEGKFVWMYVDIFSEASLIKQTRAYKVKFEHLDDKITKIEFSYDDLSTDDDLAKEYGIVDFGTMPTKARVTIGEGDDTMTLERVVSWTLFDTYTTEELTNRVVTREGRLGTGLPFADGAKLFIGGTEADATSYTLSGTTISFNTTIIPADKVEIVSGGDTTTWNDADDKTFTLKSSEFVNGLPTTVTYYTTIGGVQETKVVTIEWLNVVDLTPVTYTTSGVTNRIVYAKAICDNISILNIVDLTIEPINVLGIESINNDVRFVYDPYGIITDADLNADEEKVLFNDGDTVGVQISYVSGEDTITSTVDVVVNILDDTLLKASRDATKCKSVFGKTIDLPIRYNFADGTVVDSTIAVYIEDRTIKRVENAALRSMVVDPYYYSSFGTLFDENDEMIEGGYGYPEKVSMTMKNRLADNNATLTHYVTLPNDSIIADALKKGGYINSSYQLLVGYKVDDDVYAYQYITMPISVINRTIASEFFVMPDNYKLSKVTESSSKLTLTYVEETSGNLMRFVYSKGSNRPETIYFDNAFDFDLDIIPSQMNISFSNGEGRNYYIRKTVLSDIASAEDAKKVQRADMTIEVLNKNPQDTDDVVVLDTFKIEIVRSANTVTKFNSDIVYDDEFAYKYVFDPYTSNYADSIYNTENYNTAGEKNFADTGIFYVDGTYVLKATYDDKYANVRYITTPIASMAQYSSWVANGKTADGEYVYKVLKDGGNNTIYYRYNSDTKSYYPVAEAQDAYVFMYTIATTVNLTWDTSKVRYTYAGGIHSATVTITGSNGVAKETMQAPLSFIDRTIDNDTDGKGGIKVGSSYVTSLTFDPWTTTNHEYVDYLNARNNDGYAGVRYYLAKDGSYEKATLYYDSVRDTYYKLNGNAYASTTEKTGAIDISDAKYKAVNYVLGYDSNHTAITEERFVEMTDYEIYGTYKYLSNTGKVYFNGTSINYSSVTWNVLSVTIDYAGGVYKAYAYINGFGEYNFNGNKVGTQRAVITITVLDRTVTALSTANETAIKSAAPSYLSRGTTAASSITSINPYDYQAPTMPTSLTVTTAQGTKTFYSSDNASYESNKEYKLVWSYSKFRPSYLGGVVYINALLTGPDGSTQTYRLPFAVEKMLANNITSVYASSPRTTGNYPFTSTVTTAGKANSSYEVDPYAPLSQTLPQNYNVTFTKSKISSITIGADGYPTNDYTYTSDGSQTMLFGYAKVSMPATFALKLNTDGTITDGLTSNNDRIATIYLGSQQRITANFTLKSSKTTSTTIPGYTSGNIANFRLPYKQSGQTVNGTIVWIGTAVPKDYEGNNKLTKAQIVTFSAGTPLLSGSVNSIALPDKGRKVVYTLTAVVGALVDKNGTLLDTETLTTSRTINGITFPAGTILPKYTGVGSKYTITVNQNGTVNVG